MDGKIGRDRSDFEAGGPSRFPAVRIYAFAFIRFHGFTVLRGKAFPLVGTSLPTHPHLRGDPQAVQKLSLMSLGLDLAG